MRSFANGIDTVFFVFCGEVFVRCGLWMQSIILLYERALMTGPLRPREVRAFASNTFLYSTLLVLEL